MTEVVVTWNGDAVLAEVAAAAARGMDTAGKALAASTTRSISTPFPPASSPGQPPHRRSGGLAGAVGHRVSRKGNDVVLSVGVPADSPVAGQAKALQGGTSRMAARPFVPEPGHATTTVVGYVEAAVRLELGGR